MNSRSSHTSITEATSNQSNWVTIQVAMTETTSNQSNIA